MSWRVARSLDVLLNEIDASAPHRSKLSDGSIGDASHASRSSDHNPHVLDGKVGVVTARDYTHDPAGGFDAYKFAEALRLKNDPRVKYVISNRQIWNRDVSPDWRAYHGTNPHDHHTHVSVKEPKDLYDSASPWGVSDLTVAAAPKLPPVSHPVMALPLLKKGDKSEAVKTLQRLLLASGFDPKGLDGHFGEQTRKAVVAFQKARGLTQDGRVGAYSWKALQPPAIATVSGPIEHDLETWFTAPFPGMDSFGLNWGTTFEAFRTLPYPDPDWKRVAQGFGHNALSGMAPIPVQGGSAWSLDYAKQVYAADVAVFGRYLNYYSKVPMTMGMINSLTLDLYQQGPGNFKRSKVLERLNARVRQPLNLSIPCFLSDIAASTSCA